MQRHFKGRNSCSMLWALMAAMHEFAKTWANCTWWQCFPKLKASTQGGYIHRSKKDIHTACFRCKGQPWRVCMHNRNWETRALWQFIVSADNYFKALAISVSQAASQVWYTKADSYAPCFLNVRPELWMVCIHKCHTCASESKIPWTADVPCRLGYVFSLSLFLQRHFKGRNSCCMLWALMAALHDLQGTERIVLCDSVFPIWRSPCTTITGRHSYSMFQMQRAALEGLHAQ